MLMAERNASDSGAPLVAAKTARTVAICSLAYLLDGVVHTVMGPLAPEFGKALRLSTAELGPIFSANLIGQCAGLILFPLLVTGARARMGHRTVVILTLAGFGLFQFLSSFARSGGELFWLRVVTGFFLGGTLPSCLAMVNAVAPHARRGFLVSLMFAGYGLGATLAGVVPMIPLPAGWRGQMALVGGVCLLAAAVAFMWLPDVSGGSKQRPDATQSVIDVLRPPLAVGTLMLWLLFISLLTLSYCLSSWLPTLMVQVGRGRDLASLSLSIFGIGGILAGLTVGMLIDRFGATRVLICFMVAAAVLLFAIGQSLAGASVPVLLSMLALCGFFALGGYAGINVVLASYYPAPLQAMGIGLTKSVGRVGTVLAPVGVGLALSAGVAQTTVLSLFALPALVAVIALWVIAAARVDCER